MVVAFPAGGTLDTLARIIAQKLGEKWGRSTFKELGVPFVEETSWYGIFAPKGTPPDIIVQVNADVAAILASDDVRRRTAGLGFRPLGGPPAKLGAMLRDEIETWAKLAKNGSIAIK
jgi:tripartite-type tricarboxylate transporter receptor subunit TctC